MGRARVEVAGVQVVETGAHELDVLELTVLLGRDMTQGLAREGLTDSRAHVLVTFTERGRATAQGLADGHRELARQLFEDLPAEALDGFDTGLVHVIRRLRELTG